ncbi:Tol-Pal system protein TolR [subsurface metagenome]
MRRKNHNDMKIMPNLTPLTDAALTLIVVFLITMPALLWTGIKINATRAIRDERAEAAKPDLQPVSISITKQKVYLNGKEVDMKNLKRNLLEKLAKRKARTVIIIPDANVLLDQVVKVLDIAKQAGVDKLALLRKRGK